MIHTYILIGYENYLGINTIVLKAENKKEAITRINNRFPELRIKVKEFNLQILNKLDLVVSYNY